jgi:hypothetical protein
MNAADPELDVLRRAHDAGVRFLLIGRQACMLYGLPVLSFGGRKKDLEDVKALLVVLDLRRQESKS